MSTESELIPGELAPTPGLAYRFDKREFPWWLVVMVLIIVVMVVAIIFDPNYREAFSRIFPVPFAATQGIMLTLYVTAGSFIVAVFLGLFIGLARLSKRALIRNAAAVYIEFIRGIPMLVFIFAIAFFIAPDFSEIVGQERGWVPQVIRASAALSFFYAAFIAEVFRAGIQSVDRTQSEAGRALGLTERQITKKVVLPQAVRNMLPALGNDLISLMKDTSLVSVLAVREMTQLAKLYSGSTFRFRETYLILMVIYVVLTLSLSLLLRWYERKISIPGRLQSA